MSFTAPNSGHASAPPNEERRRLQSLTSDPTDGNPTSSTAVRTESPSSHTPATPVATTPPADIAALVETVRADHHGQSPARIHVADPDYQAWQQPPWWRTIRWSPQRGAAIALVVAVLVLACFAVYRLSAAAPPSESAVPALPQVTELGEQPPASDGLPATDNQPAAATPGSGPPAGTETSPVASPTPEAVVVSVVGVVHRSGLVTLAPGARVADALAAAGGVLPGGDRDGLNLARHMNDGEQVLVGIAPGPEHPHGPRSAIIGGDSPLTGHSVAPSAPGAPRAGSGPANAAAGPVNINTADITALDTVPGVGPATASAIVQWRETNGPFARVEQLTEVGGIGPATLAKLREHVTV